MSTRKRRDPRGLEPESPSLYTDEKASKSPPPNIVDEVIARFIVTAAPLLIAKLFPPSPPRPVDFDVSGRLHQRSCSGNHYLCGSRQVLEHWKFCPYCATELRAVQ